jgi:hypothetical protein
MVPVGVDACCNKVLLKFALQTRAQFVVVTCAIVVVLRRHTKDTPAPRVISAPTVRDPIENTQLPVFRNGFSGSQK